MTRRHPLAPGVHQLMRTVTAPPPAPFTAKRTYGLYVYQPVRTPQGVGLIVGFVRDGKGKILKVVVTTGIGQYDEGELEVI